MSLIVLTELYCIGTIFDISFSSIHPGTLVRNSKSGLCIPCAPGEPGELVGKIQSNDRGGEKNFKVQDWSYIPLDTFSKCTVMSVNKYFLLINSMSFVSLSIMQ